jgi:hypothetical protein
LALADRLQSADILCCMRTTIRLDGHLHSAAKERAARLGVTLTAVIEQALRETFSRQERQKECAPVELPVWGDGWVRPGIDPVQDFK